MRLIDAYMPTLSNHKLILWCATIILASADCRIIASKFQWWWNLGTYISSKYEVDNFICLMLPVLAEP